MGNDAPAPVRYQGRLSPEEVAAGINAAINNARRLSGDAADLLGRGSFPTAASLAALAIEEVGKIQHLRRLALAKTDAQAKAVWREIRTHRAKNGLWILPEVARQGAIRLGDLAHVIDADSEHTQILDAVKQIGFYSDCFGDRHWSEPEVSIDERLAAPLVETASALSKRQHVTTREIELWVECLGPTSDEPSKIEDAVCQWHRAMVAEGLSTRDHAGFERFVRGDSVPAPWRF